MSRLDPSLQTGLPRNPAEDARVASRGSAQTGLRTDQSGFGPDQTRAGHASDIEETGQRKPLPERSSGTAPLPVVPPDPEELRLDRLFSALSDPTRRAVLARLSAGPLSTGELAEPFAMALPSFIEHLRRLETGGLIETWKDGRSRMCRLKPGALAPVRSWMEVQRALWEARLDNLEDYLATLLKETDR